MLLRHLGRLFLHLSPQSSAVRRISWFSCMFQLEPSSFLLNNLLKLSLSIYLNAALVFAWRQFVCFTILKMWIYWDIHCQLLFLSLSLIQVLRCLLLSIVGCLFACFLLWLGHIAPDRPHTHTLRPTDTVWTSAAGGGLADSPCLFRRGKSVITSRTTAERLIFSMAKNGGLGNWVTPSVPLIIRKVLCCHWLPGLVLPLRYQS